MGIRVVPNETVPATVYKHLLPHERQVITVRFHPAVLIRPVAEVLAGLAIAGLLSTTLARHSGLALLVIWLIWFLVVLRLLYKVWEWLDDYFVVTSKRMMLATGVFSKSVNMLPLTKVTDMRFERSATGRLRARPPRRRCRGWCCGSSVGRNRLAVRRSSPPSRRPGRSGAPRCPRARRRPSA